MASIIKSSATRERPSGTLVHPVAFSFGDMSDRAEEYLGSIRDQAAEIIAEAHQQGEGIRRKSEEAGRRAAEEAIEKILSEKVAAQMATLRPAIKQLIARLDDARSAWQDHWDQAGIQLAVAIAERILRRELRQQPEITLDFVQEALAMANGSTHVVVHMNPDDLANLGNQAQQLCDTLNRLAPTEFVADPAVSRGGCRLVTRFGAIDHQIESQLARIAEELA